MKKSIGLLSALVVSTTFIVNCQKAPDKRRVRPSGGSGSQTDVVSEKALANLKVCKADVLEASKGVSPAYNQIISNRITNETTEAQKKKIQAMSVEFMAKCKVLIAALASEEEQGCKSDNTANANIIVPEKIITGCNYVGKLLETQHDHKNEFSDAYDQEVKAKEEAKKVESNLIGKSLKMSKEARALVIERNTNGGKFLIEGEILSSTSAMNAALATSKTVCTFLGEGLEIEESKETILKITKTESATKTDLEALNVDFTGKSTLLITEVKQEGDDAPSMINLLCLNLDASKLTIDKITKALGTGIASAAVQVSTEVVGEASATAQAENKPAVAATTFTSADLAAAQPAGSPQAQLLASATAQIVQNANVVTAQRAASATVVAAKPAVVASAAVVAKVEEVEEVDGGELPEVVVTAPRLTSATVTTVTSRSSSGASTTVAAREAAEDAAGQLAMLKEKAERLEAEAVAAQAEVKKLEDEKAKAEDIDAAKAKARITRESANSAKAEYDAASKTVVATI